MTRARWALPLLAVVGCADSLGAWPWDQNMRTWHDQDGDGHAAVGRGGHDCADLDPEIYPGAVTELEGSLMATICPGVLAAGSPEDEVGSGPDEALREVTLTGAFEIGVVEVTQAQFERLMVYQPSHWPGCLHCPVETVNWWEAIAYVNALSADEDLEPCYTLQGCDPSSAGMDIDCTGVSISDPDASGNPYLCEGYRLPMEAEWGYAYRAGTTTAFYNGEFTKTNCESDPNLDAIGWYCGNSDSTTHMVSPLNIEDGKAANAWGLYDMSGNVWEWVWDEYQSDYYSSSAEENPLGGTGSYRVIRGGSWNNHAQPCRAAYRNNYHPGDRNYYLGFRPSRSIP